MARAGNELFDQLDWELNFGFRRVGSLVVAFSTGGANTGGAAADTQAATEQRLELERLLVNGRRNGVRDLRIVERDELLRMEPHLTERALCALHCPHTGVLSPYEYAIALAENAIENGVRFTLNATVVHIQAVVVGVVPDAAATAAAIPPPPPTTTTNLFRVTYRERNPSTSNSTVDLVERSLHTRLVINCAGLHSDKVAAMVGADDFRILPRKGTQRAYS